MWSLVVSFAHGLWQWLPELTVVLKFSAALISLWAAGFRTIKRYRYRRAGRRTCALRVARGRASSRRAPSTQCGRRDGVGGRPGSTSSR